VMAKYQPGGAAEKQQLLSFLVSPDTVIVPDPSLQLKGLERLALLDQAPTQQTVLQFSELLLAEAEVGGNPGKGNPKGKSKDEAMKAQDKGTGETGKSARDELIAKANAVLESIQTSIKALQLGPKYPPKPGPLDETGLIDSGATTCMRMRRGNEHPVGEKTVSLAQGEVQMGFSAGGVLLASEEVEPIVSLRQLIAIGFRLVWSKRACQLFDEEGYSVPLSTASGCPRVCRAVAQSLIDRIETFNIHGYGEDQLARVRDADTVSWENVMHRVAESVREGKLRDAQMWHQVLCEKLFPELPRAAAQAVSLISNGTGPPGAFNRRHEFDSVAAKHGATVIAVDATEDLNVFRVRRVLFFYLRFERDMEWKGPPYAQEFCAWYRIEMGSGSGTFHMGNPGASWAMNIQGPGQSQVLSGCSVDWARWAPGLVQAVGEYIDAALQQGSTVEGLRRMQVQQSMKDHVLAGHVPYRKDCYACVAGRAKKQNHYRQTVSDSFVLSVDLAGPFKNGVHEGAKARYFLAAVFSIPRAPELNGSKGDKHEAAEEAIPGEPGEWEIADEDRDDDEGTGVGPIELDDAPADPEPQPLEQLELVHLPFVVPLPSKGGRDVMNAIKGIE
ncbi:GIP, partial [Symbiodinium sp. CCMP2456]